MAEFVLIGVYRVKPTLETLSLAARYHGFNWLLNANGEFREAIDWSSFESLALIELQVFGDFSREDLLRIRQNDQSPYLEYYIDVEGANRLEERDAGATEGRRVCFFLHFTDTSRPIEIGERRLQLPEFSELPDRLIRFTHYVPVD